MPLPSNRSLGAKKAWRTRRASLKQQKVRLSDIDANPVPEHLPTYPFKEGYEAGLRENAARMERLTTEVNLLERIIHDALTR